jgi:small basic protein
MIYVAAGLVLGIVAGLNINIIYNPDYIVYISLSILAILNTIFNMLHENKTGELTFLKSIAYLFTDLIYALFLGYVGEQLGLPIYLAAVFAFGNNIYKKLRILVNITLEKFQENK